MDLVACTYSFLNTGPAASMKLAVPTLKNPPVRPGVTQMACPLRQGIVRLDHPERMSTISRDRHVAGAGFGLEVDQ